MPRSAPRPVLAGTTFCTASPRKPCASRRHHHAESEHPDREARMHGVDARGSAGPGRGGAPTATSTTAAATRPTTARPRRARPPRSRRASAPRRPGGTPGPAVRPGVAPAEARRGGRGTAAAARRTPRPVRRASTGAIRTAKPSERRGPRWGRASRLVRLETGSRSEAEFAIRRQAKVPGRRRTDRAMAAASTTGVSSTTVASRLSMAVTTAASTEHAE